MAEAINSFANETEQRTEELNACPQTGPNVMRSRKRVINNAAVDLEGFADLMHNEIPIYSSNFAEGMDAASRSVALSIEFGVDPDEDMKEAYQALLSLRDTIAEAKPIVAEFRKVIHTLPRITTIYNRAKRKAVDALDQYNRELDSSLSQIEETCAVFERVFGSTLLQE